jgi:hypothetical protein
VHRSRKISDIINLLLFQFRGYKPPSIDTIIQARSPNALPGRVKERGSQEILDFVLKMQLAQAIIITLLFASVDECKIK